MNTYLDINGKNIECILLATFAMETEKEETKKFLCFNYNKYVKKYREMALVFIPWKYNLKELRIVYLEELSSLDYSYTSELIKIDNFTSPFEEELPYRVEYLIKDFNGYKFVYEYKNFIANIKQQTPNKCFELLYKELPDLVKIDNGL